MKKLDAVAVTIAMLFVAAAFAGGMTKDQAGGLDKRAHYCDPEFIAGDVMRTDYRVPYSNQGE